MRCNIIFQNVQDSIIPEHFLFEVDVWTDAEFINFTLVKSEIPIRKVPVRRKITFQDTTFLGAEDFGKVLTTDPLPLAKTPIMILRFSSLYLVKQEYLVNSTCEIWCKDFTKVSLVYYFKFYC